MGRLDGRVAFITGGARGQGRAIALRFAGEGADIIVCDVCETGPVPYPLATEADLQETAEGVRAAGRGCVAAVADVRSQESLDAVVAEGIDAFGQIDVACANAGIFWSASLCEMTEAVWDTVIGVNLTGAWHTTKAVAPHMIARRSGSLIYTVSTNGWHGGYSYSAYTASKHGVAGLMKCAALELGRYNIRANALLPGAVHSPMMVNAYSKEFVTGSAEASDERLDRQVRHNTILPGRRMLPPSAVADAALWLASDESQHVTGAEITVDAGHTRLPHYNWDPLDEPA
ncbi:MAG: mycofactocin-coupled SDR family oxidoreductase [Acidimicrobiia bacterium]|nr:mycofactocin-coupled SDR family oxidoreductase [Acidimicrobiia bacterium]MYB24034.1 mycofactocin-coupled SDR family oxidoreductase [Acidimicrobiia bacterium]MYJ12829.1 mycofactocin-coupled SDR family oxidoreductase [Acidimicrobiia bacterium]